MDGLLLFILLAVTAGILIIALTHVSLLILSATKWKRQAEIYQSHNKITAPKPEDKSGSDEDGGTSANFTALIDAIKAEGRANRDEEKREDHAGEIREWVTICVIGFTLIAIGWQVSEMIKVYGPIKDQAEAAKKSAETAEISQRAWIGPINGAFDKPLVVGESVRIDITYQNTGREPGIGLSEYVVAFDKNVRNLPDSSVTSQIADNITKCKSTLPTEGGGIAFPNANSAAYSMHSDITSSPVDNTIKSWKHTVLVVGCLAYLTYGKPRHTAFCYYFQAGATDYRTLSICQGGNYAD